MSRKRRLPDNVSAYVDRHGKERFRYRKTGQKPHTFKAPFGTPEFDDELAACRAGAPVTASPPAIPRSIEDLVRRFYRSPAFLNGGDDWRRISRGIIEPFRQQHGKKKVATLGFEHVEAILIAKSRKRTVGNRTVGGPTASRNLAKQLNRLFELAVKLKWIETNPVQLAEKVKVPKGGFHTWTEEEIAQFKARHALGTKARLAMEIILWTAQRRGDAHRFGPKHLKGGRINYTQAKGGKDLWLPAAPDLLAAIAAMPAIGLETFVVTEFGKPFTKAGFGNWFRDRCDEAGLPQCSAHGLRKAIARRLAESGAGNQGIKAVGGWSKDDEVATYTAAVEQAALAEQTLGRLFSKGEAE